MQFNGTINETQARLCPNGTCAEGAVANLIMGTNMTGLLNDILGDN